MRHLRSAVLPITAALVAVALAGCGSTRVVTNTVIHEQTVVQRVTRTIPLEVHTLTQVQTVTTFKTITRPAAPVGGLGSTSANGVLTLTGQATENMGTITVPSQSTLRWTCARCADDNFMIGNSASDAESVNVNSLDQTSGETIIDAGTYHDFEVEGGSGPWTITITPG